MPLSCFGRKNKNKKPREPPPSVNELDNRAVNEPRQDRHYSVEFSGRAAAPPPLPQRHNTESPSGTLQSNNNSPHSPKLSATKQEQSEKSLKGHRPTSNVPNARQLPSNILSTPVPVGNTGSSPKINSKSQRNKLERQESEEYLDPCEDNLTSIPPVRAPTPPEKKKIPKLKASLSEEKKSDILSDYFHSQGMRGLNVVVPPTSDPGQPQHDYTNVSQLEYPETFHSPTATKSESNDALKSPRKPPQPMPRQNVGSQKSEGDDTEFAYENVTDILRRLSDTPASGSSSRSTTPRPQPRARTTTDNKSSQDHTNTLPKPEPLTANGGLSPLQQKALHKPGYVYDADYVPPSDHPEAVIHSHDSPAVKIPLNGSQHSSTLPTNGSVDLSAPIPKGGFEQGLIAQGRKGYVPMDQNPLSQPTGNGLSHQHSTDKYTTAQLLNQKIPVPTGNINDVHVKGYITVLSDPVPPPTKNSKEYYNLNTKPDYLNVQTTPLNGSATS